MRKKSVLKFIRNGKFLKGCAALSATVLVGVLSFQRQLPDLPGSVPVGTVVTLEEEDTPLAATPVTTTDKKVKKKVYEFLLKKVKENRKLRIDVKNYL
jgi:phosphoribosylcarboxyaminoimidazole (NCAIR) mutase